MIHRYIHEILTAGVAAYKADSKLVNDLFDELYELESSEISAIKEYISTEDFKVYDSYPRVDTTPPYVCIILASEGEADTYLGDYAGMIDEDGHALYGMDIEGSLWNHVYNLIIVTEHPDITSYYYELIKIIMVAGLRVLTNYDCCQYGFSGQDLAPDPRYIPERFFVRQLTFSCKRQFSWIDRDSRLTKAFEVAGIHIDRSGSPSDVGSVETLVTPYGLGGDDNGEEE